MKKRLLALVGAGVAIAGYAVLSVALKTATGMTAHGLCSFAFVSRLDDATARAAVDPVAKIGPIATTEIDREARTVSVRALGVSAFAVHRERLGCTLVHGDAAAVRAAWTPPPRPPRAPVAELVDVAAAGVDAAKLTDALDRAFRDDPEKSPRNTLAVLVVRDGAVIGERYAHGVTRDTPLLGWSMTKSVTFALAGILVRDGKLDIHAPGIVWPDPADPRHAVTIDHLLRMTSGLAAPEDKSPFDAVSRMLFHEPDMAAYVSRAPLEDAPGARWRYTSADTVLVSRAIRERVGDTLADQLAFIDRELFAPLGIASAVFEPDEAGTLIGSSYLHASPRDWARLGELYLADGVWNGARILPEGWMASGLTRTPRAPSGRYGAGFWLNVGADGDPRDRMWPELPVDAFLALGFQGQGTIVIPSHRLVIVRLGYAARTADVPLDELAAAVIAAMPDAPPAP